MLLTAWLPSPHFSEPTLFRSATPTPGLGTHTDSLVLTNGRGERAEGPFRQGELSLSAMFHPSTISEKPGLLWEFGPQLSLGSTTEARSRSSGHCLQTARNRKASCSSAPPSPPLTSSLLGIPRLHSSPDSQVRWQDQQTACLLCQEVLCPPIRASGGTAGADCVESGGWNRPLQRPSRSGFPSCSAECMIWTSYCTCRSICHVGVRCLVLG